MRVGDPIRILRGPLCVMPGKHAESAVSSRATAKAAFTFRSSASLRFWFAQCGPSAGPTALCRCLMQSPLFLALASPRSTMKAIQAMKPDSRRLENTARGSLKPSEVSIRKQGFDMNQPMRLSTSRAEGAVLRNNCAPLLRLVRSPPRPALRANRPTQR